MKIILSLVFFLGAISSNAQQAKNPIIFSDVPDVAIIRVGDNYYMSSTTTHMVPNVPIMKSTDLVNWKMVSYPAGILAATDELNLANGKDAYSRGSWASSIRYHKGTYYVTTFAGATQKTYIYTTKDIEKGPWKEYAFTPMFHDHSLFFDDDGKTYLVYGAGKIKLVELNDDASGVKPGIEEKLIIENASAPAGENIGLAAEGSQLFKHDGKYYLFNITWPKGGMRTVVIHRADKLTGPWEGRVALQDRGIAQGGLIDTKDGRWFAYLFQDYGSLGRIPFLVPVKWTDGWPVIGENGKVPENLDLPASKGLIPGIVASDNFTRKKGEPALPLVWQWNHNPDNKLWSVTDRKGFFRVKTDRVDTSFLTARNTLTQRTIGPVCSGIAVLDVSGLKDGDFAGLGLLQKIYGTVGVKVEGSKKMIVSESVIKGLKTNSVSIPLNQSRVYLKADCDFANMKDVAQFSYSLDGKEWKQLGEPLKMSYTLPHFIGYRFGLFYYSTKLPGGKADFDEFRVF